MIIIYLNQVKPYLLVEGNLPNTKVTGYSSGKVELLVEGKKAKMRFKDK